MKTTPRKPKKSASEPATAGRVNVLVAGVLAGCAVRLESSAAEQQRVADLLGKLAAKLQSAGAKGRPQTKAG
jgi:Tfp pilus assembly protein PilN